MDAHHAFAFLQSKGVGYLRVKDFSNFLNFQIMIAGAERAHLAVLTFPRKIRYSRRISPCHATELFDPVQILLPSIAALDRPARTPPKHCCRLWLIERDGAVRAKPDRHLAIKGISELRLHREDLAVA